MLTRTPLTAQDVLSVPGVLGHGLAPDIAAQLPEKTPRAPWHSNIETALWSFRSTPASAAALGAGLTPSLPVGACAFISYLDGAVGPYHEILATPRCVRTGDGPLGIAGHVPFIAVDSIPSVHGGRANWALPKTVAEFSGEPARDAQLTGTGADWSVGATVRQHGPWFPFRASGACAQPWPDGGVGVFASRFRGRARLALIEVTVRGPASLTSILPGGRHVGAVIRGTVDVGAPTL
jgi:hypothetical protein